jgi:hypothetical protein
MDRAGVNKILKRAGLEDAACEGSATMRDYEERHLG